MTGKHLLLYVVVFAVGSVAGYYYCQNKLTGSTGL